MYLDNLEMCRKREEKLHTPESYNAYLAKYMEMGRLLEQQNRGDEALIIYENILRINVFRDLWKEGQTLESDSNYSWCCSKIVNILDGEGKLEEACRWLKISLIMCYSKSKELQTSEIYNECNSLDRLFEEVKEKIESSKIDRVEESVSSRQERLESRRQHYQQLPEVDRHKDVAESDIEIGRIFEMHQDLENALKFYQNGFMIKKKICREVHLPESYYEFYRCCFHVAHMLLKQRQGEKALKVYLEVLTINTNDNKVPVRNSELDFYSVYFDELVNMIIEQQALEKKMIGYEAFDSLFSQYWMLKQRKRDFKEQDIACCNQLGSVLEKEGQFKLALKVYQTEASLREQLNKNKSDQDTEAMQKNQRKIEKLTELLGEIEREEAGKKKKEFSVGNKIKGWIKR